MSPFTPSVSTRSGSVADNLIWESHTQRALRKWKCSCCRTPLLKERHVWIMVNGLQHTIKQMHNEMHVLVSAIVRFCFSLIRLSAKAIDDELLVVTEYLAFWLCRFETVTNDENFINTIKKLSKAQPGEGKCLIRLTSRLKSRLPMNIISVLLSNHEWT